MLAPLRRAWNSWPPRMAAEWIGITVLSTILAALLLLAGLSARLDNLAYDAALRLAPRPTGAEVIIVAIDERSLAALGAWPWPRSVHAAVLDRLTAAGARAVAYDVLFIEPGPPAEDAALARALAASGRTCLPVLVEAPGPDGAAFQLVPPTAPLARAAAGLGHVDMDYDPDGLSRRANLSEAAGGGRLGHLMRCVQQVAEGRPPRGPLPRAVANQPLLRQETVLIPYGGGPGRVRAVSAISVLRGEVPADYFRGRYVIVGATAAGLHDTHSTPVSTRNETMAGVEVQANLLEGLLDGHLIQPAPVGVQLGLTLVLVWVFLTALLVVPLRWTLALGVAITLLTFALSALSLGLARQWIAPFPAVLALHVIMPLWAWRRLEAANAYMRAELERFAQEEGVLTGGDLPTVAGDPVERQIMLMGHAVARARALRRQREQMTELLSHDIRSPQSSILALLETSHAEPDLARRIAAYARKTLALADNFVHLAKAESGQITPELLDLSALATEALDDLWPVSHRANVRLETIGGDEEYLVLGDRSLLCRAVVNLVDNAVKHSPAGGVVTAALARDGDGGSVSLAISDQGPGLSEAQQAGLFQRFGRPEASRPGVGLGLTLVDQVARRHGGSIACVSRPGQGATFVLTLPAAEEEEASPP